MTFSEPQRGAVTGARTIDRRSDRGRGSAPGTRPERNWAKLTRERPEIFAVQLHHVPRRVHTEAKRNFQSRRRSRRRTCLFDTSLRPFVSVGPFAGAPPRTENKSKMASGRPQHVDTIGGELVDAFIELKTESGLTSATRDRCEANVIVAEHG